MAAVLRDTAGAARSILAPPRRFADGGLVARRSTGVGVALIPDSAIARSRDRLQCAAITGARKPARHVQLRPQQNQRTPAGDRIDDRGRVRVRDHGRVAQAPLHAIRNVSGRLYALPVVAALHLLAARLARFLENAASAITDAASVSDR